MAIDFEDLVSNPLKFASAQSGKLSLEDALEQSYKTCKNQIKQYQKNGAPQNNRSPSSWIKAEIEDDKPTGRLFVQYRLLGKPLWFGSDIVKKKKGWLECKNGQTPETLLNSIMGELQIGKHKEALNEAYNRTSKPASEFTIRKRIARQEAKTNGFDTFTIDGKTYTTDKGKLINKAK